MAVIGSTGCAAAPSARAAGGDAEAHDPPAESGGRGAGDPVAPADRTAGACDPRASRAGCASSGSGVRAGGPIAWQLSEQDARARAHRLHLPMVVYVRAEWAVASLELERTLWRDARVAREASRFVALRLDVSAANPDDETYAERYGVASVPSIVLIDASGRRVASFGHGIDIEQVLSAMRSIE